MFLTKNDGLYGKRQSSTMEKIQFYKSHLSYLMFICDHFEENDIAEITFYYLYKNIS